MHIRHPLHFALKALPLAITAVLLPSQVLADEATEERIAQLEQQVRDLQKQQTASLTDSFTFNGFMSGAYVTADNNSGYLGTSTSADFSEESKLGFQATFSISDQTQAVMQLMMKGENDWDVEAEWAYVSHRFNNGVQIRGGKLRVPLFMYSDYLDVGYAQPFARPPEEVYGAVPFTTYIGGDVSYDVEFDDSTLTIQAFGGESEEDNTDIKNIIGANVMWTDETWTLRAVYGQTTLDGSISRTIKIPSQDPSSGLPIEIDAQLTLLTLDNEKATFSGVGASYDNGQFLAITEWTRSEVDGKYTDVDSGYVTLGYRINAFTPYITAAYYESQDDNERVVVDAQSALIAAIFNGQRTAYSAGLRWDALDNLALKFDVTYANDFGDTSGGFQSNILQQYDDVTVYTVKFDVVF
ncbi:hypothetical protein K0I73_07890 [Shewanella mesophila]|uniref:hypothetical protein n=1 Tax=Shewanella mesophila TaxID=2864208 RepID=UPI001C65F3D6|nr:hypothetical protein [Shewanella mesophila]QYJ87601.1 hypothetical protein K0I73_07890 [Shewanella mesophila]